MITSLSNLPYGDPESGPALVFARRDIRHKNLERPNLWYCSVRNMPEGWTLPIGLKKPFMNYTEARTAFNRYMGWDDRKAKRVHMLAFRGQRTWYPKDGLELERVLVPVGQLEPERMKHTLVPTGG